MIPQQSAIEEREAFINKSIQAEKEAKEKHEAKILKAASVLEVLETDGGKQIKAQITEMKELWNMPPEQLMRASVVGQDGVPLHQEVDVTLVARLAGAREALDALLSWFDSCESIVKYAAKEKSVQQ